MSFGLRFVAALWRNASSFIRGSGRPGSASQDYRIDSFIRLCLHRSFSFGAGLFLSFTAMPCVLHVLIRLFA